MGADTADILREILSYNDKEIELLHQNAVI